MLRNSRNSQKARTFANTPIVQKSKREVDARRPFRRADLSINRNDDPGKSPYSSCSA
jgi:hypothetical protein